MEKKWIHRIMYRSDCQLLSNINISGSRKWKWKWHLQKKLIENGVILDRSIRQLLSTHLRCDGWGIKREDIHSNLLATKFDWRGHLLQDKRRNRPLQIGILNPKNINNIQQRRFHHDTKGVRDLLQGKLALLHWLSSQRLPIWIFKVQRRLYPDQYWIFEERAQH